MKRYARLTVAVCLLLCVAGSAQQTKKTGVLSAPEVKKLAPSAYYFAGQSAPVQLRNAVALRTANGKMVLAGLVDTSGYSSDIQQKYQGFFITESKLKIGDSELNPGEYGFGFMKDGKFIVMDVAANDVLTTPAQNDTSLAHPVPLKMAEENGSYRLYAGRQYVTLAPE